MTEQEIKLRRKDQLIQGLKELALMRAKTITTLRERIKTHTARIERLESLLSEYQGSAEIDATPYEDEDIER